jgi:hypothetical protein
MILVVDRVFGLVTASLHEGKLATEEEKSENRKEAYSTSREQCDYGAFT